MERRKRRSFTEEFKGRGSLLFSALLASCLATAWTPAAADVLDDRLARLRDGADCANKASPLRVWCPAADFKRGNAGPSLAGKTLVGFTVRLPDGGKVTDALSGNVSLAALAIGPDGKAVLVDVRPTNKGEEEEVARGIISLTLVLKGQAATATLAPGLAGYFKSVKGRYPATKGADEWTWTGAAPTRMRQVGKVWVVLETPADGKGIFATVLTDAWN
jgi:hypothetical protein